MKKFNPFALHLACIPKRSTLPILENVLIQDRQVFSTDLDCTVQTNSVDLQDGVYRIMGKKEFYPMQEKIEDFPQVDTEKQEETVLTFDCQLSYILPILIRACEFVSDDELRPAMMGIFLQVTPQSTIKIIATDGHKLFNFDTTIKHNMERECGFIIPVKFVKLLKASGAKDNVTFKIVSSETRNGDIGTIIASHRDFTITARIIGEKYPNYLCVYPYNITKLYSFDRKMLIAALEQIKPYTHGEVSLILKDENTLVIGESVDFDCFKSVQVDSTSVKLNESMDLKNSSDSILLMPVRANSDDEREMRFNFSYLVDVLKALDSEKVTMYSSSNSRVTLWKS